MTPFILLLLGLLLIFLEFYMPGAIMAILGTIMVVASIFSFIGQDHSLEAILIFTLGVVASVIFLIKYTLKYIPKAKNDYSIYLKGDQEGYVASTFDKSAIGKNAKVLADLKPGGYILVDGKRQQAISISGYISEGNEVIVIAGEGESLIVKKVKKSDSE
jgi:membrane-bound ClpP family serine protease